MARLNITISDELYKALEQWRDHLNLSKICQEAIAREVAKLEELPKAMMELETLVARLQQEKDHTETFWFGQGVTDGVAWARGASYSALRFWGERKGLEPLSREDDERALQMAKRQYRKDPTFDTKPYTDGWVAGVKEVWQRVKNTI
jgi:hypothetical protein